MIKVKKHIRKNSVVVAHSRKPKILKRLTFQIASKGVPKSHAECIAKGTLKKNGILDDNYQLTSYGKKRDSMSAAERAIARRSKETGKPTHKYKYNHLTNSARVK